MKNPHPSQELSLRTGIVTFLIALITWGLAPSAEGKQGGAKGGGVSGHSGGNHGGHHGGHRGGHHGGHHDGHRGGHQGGHHGGHRGGHHDSHHGGHYDGGHHRGGSHFYFGYGGRNRHYGGYYNRGLYDYYPNYGYGSSCGPTYPYNFSYPQYYSSPYAYSYPYSRYNSYGSNTYPRVPALEYGSGYATPKQLTVSTEDGWKLLREDQPRAAFQAFSEEATANPEKGAPKVGYSLASAELGDLDRGIWAMRRALRIDPYSLQYIALGDEIRSRLGDLIYEYEHAPNHSKENPDDAFMLAVLHYLSGDLKAAQLAIGRVVESGDTARSSRNLVRVIDDEIQGQDLEESAELVDALENSAPDSIDSATDEKETQSSAGETIP